MSCLEAMYVLNGVSSVVRTVDAEEGLETLVTNVITPQPPLHTIKTAQRLLLNWEQSIADPTPDQTVNARRIVRHQQEVITRTNFKLHTSSKIPSF